jgi:hypothetical protein
MAKTHTALVSKSTGATVILCANRGAQHTYASGNVVSPKLFDGIPAVDQCKHCAAELRKLRDRIAKKAAVK